MRNHWNFQRADFERTISPDRLQGIIDQKNTKLPTYRGKCCEVWLLIVLDGLYPSSFADLNADALQHEFKTGFDRLFFFRNFDGSYAQLRRGNR